MLVTKILKRIGLIMTSIRKTDGPPLKSMEREKVSVVIPTCQPIFLEECLNSLSQQTARQEDFEVIVVENHTITDFVKPLVERYKKNLDITYLKSKSGSNTARNVGIRQAKHKIIALTDDDCLSSQTWIKRIQKIHKIYPGAGVIGGSVVLIFPDGRPRWLVYPLTLVLSEIDWHNHQTIKYARMPFEIRSGHKMHLASANISFRRDVFDQLGGFPENIGYHGRDEFIAHDELSFIRQAKEKFHPGILYDKNMTIEHQIPAERADIKYLLKRYYGQGIADIREYKMQYKGISAADIYHNYVQCQLENLIDMSAIMKNRVKIADEETTRTFISYYIQCQTAYILGAQDEINGNTLWRKDLTSQSF